MTGMTQYGCALAELNIEILCANSSQAKGRVERANRTLQDRLVKELRLAGAASVEDGNAFLEGFTQRYNAKFAKAPAKPDSLSCGQRVTRELDRITEIRGYPRMVVRDHGTELTSNAILKCKRTARSIGTTLRRVNQCKMASLNHSMGVCATND